MHDDFLQGPFVSPSFLPFMNIMSHLCYSQVTYVSMKLCLSPLEMVFGFDFMESNYVS